MASVVDTVPSVDNCKAKAKVTHVLVFDPSPCFLGDLAKKAAGAIEGLIASATNNPATHHGDAAQGGDGCKESELDAAVYAAMDAEDKAEEYLEMIRGLQTVLEQEKSRRREAQQIAAWSEKSRIRAEVSLEAQHKCAQKLVNELQELQCKLTFPAELKTAVDGSNAASEGTYLLENDSDRMHHAGKSAAFLTAELELSRRETARMNEELARVKKELQHAQVQSKNRQDANVTLRTLLQVAKVGKVTAQESSSPSRSKHEFSKQLDEDFQNVKQELKKQQEANNFLRRSLRVADAFTNPTSLPGQKAHQAQDTARSLVAGIALKAQWHAAQTAQEGTQSPARRARESLSWVAGSSFDKKAAASRFLSQRHSGEKRKKKSEKRPKPTGTVQTHDDWV